MKVDVHGAPAMPAGDERPVPSGRAARARATGNRLAGRMAENFRLTAALFLLFLVCGPAPGAVGSCEEQRRVAELRPYCEEREQLVCWRRYLRGELGGGEREVNECRATAIAQCQNRYWPPDCRPSERQTGACLNALRSYDTLYTPESEIPECSVQRLCGSAGGPGPEDADGGEGAR